MLVQLHQQTVHFLTLYLFFLFVFFAEFSVSQAFRDTKYNHFKYKNIFLHFTIIPWKVNMKMKIRSVPAIINLIRDFISSADNGCQTSFLYLFLFLFSFYFRTHMGFNNNFYPSSTAKSLPIYIYIYLFIDT